MSEETFQASLDEFEKQILEQVVEARAQQGMNREAALQDMALLSLPADQDLRLQQLLAGGMTVAEGLAALTEPLGPQDQITVIGTKEKRTPQVRQALGNRQRTVIAEPDGAYPGHCPPAWGRDPPDYNDHSPSRLPRPDLRQSNGCRRIVSLRLNRRKWSLPRRGVFLRRVAVAAGSGAETERRD